MFRVEVELLEGGMGIFHQLFNELVFVLWMNYNSVRREKSQKAPPELGLGLHQKPIVSIAESLEDLNLMDPRNKPLLVLATQLYLFVCLEACQTLFGDDLFQ